MPTAGVASLDTFTAAGYRTLAVAAGPADAMEMLGLIAFSDPPRADSKPLLAELLGLGVRVVMVTGDAAATAATVAGAIGLQGPISPAGKIPDSADPADFAVYAGVFPEDKFRLVQAFQHTGHTVGMCGDGANDAPALRQAQMGIAVSTATDVAKAAAGIVLTEPGLAGIVTSISEGRSAFQRVLTYTLSLLINKCVTLVVLGAGLVITGQAVMTPMLQALWMLAGDLVTMSRAADHAKPAPYPNVWRVRNLTLAAIPLGTAKLAYCVSILAWAWYGLHLKPDEMRTLTFLMLVLAGQATMFVLRARGHFWLSLPVPIMLIASGTNMAIVTGLVLTGVLVTPLPAWIVGSLYLATVSFMLVFDALKILVRSRIRID
jgi:H+-transporting ATPase